MRGGACFDTWYVFFVGVATQRLVSRDDWKTYAAVLALVGLGAEREATANAPVAIGLVAVIGHFTRRLDVWLSARPWQWLGRISYSFYLVHWVVARQLTRLLDRALTPSLAAHVALSAGAVVAALGVAWAFWWTFERPSLTLSRHIAVRAPEEIAPLNGDVTNVGRAA
jgi:peptidoglycan/LPS O-acetylase OafA/YrhL